MAMVLCFRLWFFVQEVGLVGASQRPKDVLVDANKVQKY